MVIFEFDEGGCVRWRCKTGAQWPGWKIVGLGAVPLGWCWELYGAQAPHQVEDVGVLGSQVFWRAGEPAGGFGRRYSPDWPRSAGWCQGKEILRKCRWGLRFSWGPDFVSCHGPGRAAVLQSIALCRPGALTAARAL